MLMHNIRAAAWSDDAGTNAGWHSLETLLNCYYREVAAPEGQVLFASPFGQNDWPMALRSANGGGRIFQLHLPHSHVRLVAQANPPLPVGRLRLRSPLYGRMPEKPWALVDWRDVAALLIRELSLREGVAFNDELLSQICDSVENVMAFLSASNRRAGAAQPLTGYIESEQALVLGHAFHPAPKSRLGFDENDCARYSPELRTHFPLHWFAVPRELLRQRSLLAQTTDALIGEDAAGLAAPDRALIPVHPWQAWHILGLPAVRQAMAEGRLMDLGPLGRDYIPTSSVRTLFHPSSPFFLKLSLHVRLTNCLRKNAHYELEGAVEVTRLMREVMPRMAMFPNLRVLEEPAYLTVDFPDAEPTARTDVQEAFGLILREGVQSIAGEGITPILAAALFADDAGGMPRASDLCRAIARRERLSYLAAAERWFDAYADGLIAPVLHALFAEGIVFEPHLQNTLVGLRDGWPERIVLRDFEGVKLVTGRFDENRLAHVSPAAGQALWYDEERGWNRIAYCLFVNQLGEAVDHLAAGDAVLAAKLWRIVRHKIEQYQTAHGSRKSAEKLDSLLSGAPLPAKTNLLVRFTRQADRHATYAPLDNPLVEAGQ
ncbi:siderophore synthetase component [Novosphingobium kunmingense]|uniref:Siderophore synthetase component n=1 Tax=Novosphingobium kunmingense TaxID=1211806 RepID=A0A2N0I2G6_9SPHN|nr:IucA/IucC family protein [Novosphingobium kunmingense]PKB25372.1 siderophore synthetase component [Novosphingobium kunmingense]